MNAEKRGQLLEILAAVMAIGLWQGILHLLKSPAAGMSSSGGIGPVIGSGIVFFMCVTGSRPFVRLLLHFLVPPTFPKEEVATLKGATAPIETRQVSALFRRQRPSTRARVMREP